MDLWTRGPSSASVTFMGFPETVVPSPDEQEAARQAAQAPQARVARAPTRSSVPSIPAGRRLAVLAGTHAGVAWSAPRRPPPRVAPGREQSDDGGGPADEEPV